jgi:2-succinyl-5-enolpyruvyl-6-hydroxy-3-cyclohexene-1-carboxylate synthase
MPIRDQEAFVPSGPAQVRFLCNRGANGIDGLVSSGIGAASVSGRPTWIVTGDLGLIHDANGLAALPHASAPVRIVVLNNEGGGIFEFLPQAAQIEREEFEALFGTPSGLDLARVAALYGLPHVRVERLARLPDLAGETALIEVPVDRRRNVELHHRLAAAAAAALATGDRSGR